ncbi:hypothetical protein DHEL01_v206381 [Diaporthe helianthi]|uniref:Xylanolytic transcriptional activator regulatory domain-containing protein n=1 Tax=Diaporthe helianthi TaxID=158607 RepID=A0A2P5HYA6_DIAHE|nr:hypothetical protein DHEL01_v206381 [Diaporthe helianthi]
MLSLPQAKDQVLGYLVDLQRRSGRLPPAPPRRPAAEGSVSALSVSAQGDDDIYGDGDSHNNLNLDDAAARMGSSEDQGPNEQAGITNALAASPSTFMSTSDGRTFYLGTTSNWSFSSKLLQMAYEYLHQAPLPPSMVLFDGGAYDLGWNCRDGMSDTSLPSDSVTDLPPLAVPSIDHSEYLINAVKFHCGQIFHLFDDSDFHQRLYQFYAGPDRHVARENAGLWYIHFLLILAFGKIFTMKKPSGKRPCGAEFFLKAMQILPPPHILHRDPVVATEMLCCIALYLQSVDHRNAAHLFIGQAMRTALAYGMHTDMPVVHLGEPHVQRCRRIWWTVYILDRQMTSLMGLPQSIQDGDVHCRLPVYQGSPKRTASLDLHIKLARLIAEVNNTVYGANGKPNKNFLLSTKAALEHIAVLASELTQTLPLRLDQGQSVDGVSRMSASLHLLYHQCIVLATRPLVFCCLKIRLESPAGSKPSTPDRFGTVLQMCMEAAQKIIIILENLQAQGLLEIFLSLDLDPLYVSSTVLLVAAAVDKGLLVDRDDWVRRSLALLEDIESSGNLIASWRKSEFQRLDEMVNEISDETRNKPPSSTGGPAPSENLGGPSFQGNASQSEPNNIHLANPGFMHLPQPGLFDTSTATIGGSDDLWAEHILAIAGSIQDEDVEWIDRAIVDNSIW